jgi:hypothetical protein
MKSQTELVNVNKCKQIMSLSKRDIKETFWDVNETFQDNQCFNWSQYFLNIKKFLKTTIVSEGKLDVKYEYAKGCSSGRLYTSNGIQSMQSSIRNYIAGEYYTDYDMINCHPSILLHICKTMKIPATFLEQYVVNRANVLADNDLNKLDILTAINTDNNKKKRNNDYYNCFIFELIGIKKHILEQITITTTNDSNPDSSKINKYMCQIENDILTKASEYFGDCHKVLMFDGIMVDKAMTNDNDVKKLNKLFKKEYNGLIKWAVKSTDSNIELTNDVEELLEYGEQKEIFELTHFKSKSPFAFWICSTNSENINQWNQVTDTDFKNDAKKYQYMDFKNDGSLCKKSIFDKWMTDTTAREYETVEFIPYGQMNPTPSHVYNTFEHFEVNSPKHQDEYETVNTDNFDELINNLSNDNSEIAEYLMNYIAHMFQYPNINPQKIIVLKGWTGTGKDSLFITLQKLMGQSYVSTTSDLEKIFGSFNDILSCKLGLFLNEMEGSSGIRYKDRLKALSTVDSHNINAKHEKVIHQKNYSRLFINSNNDGCVNVDVNDRRYIIVSTGFKLVGNTKFWTKYYNNLDSIDWKKSLYAKLMNIDLTDFNVKDVPYNKEYDVMREKNISPLFDYMRHIIDNDEYDDMFEHINKNNEKVHLVKFKDFFKNYMDYLSTTGVEPDYQIKQTTIKQKLMTCNNSFIPFKQLWVNGKNTKWSIFDMNKMDEFLKTFIYKSTNTDDDEYIDNLVACPVTKKIKNDKYNTHLL